MNTNTSTGTGTGRRTRVLKVALAGIAILGIGAAITTAAWTDDVFFGADATASSFDLQGAANPEGAACDATLTYGDEGLPGDVAEIDITTAELGALSPEDVVVVPFCLYNAGSLSGTLTPPAAGGVTVAGTLFDGGFLTPADIAVALDATTIAAGGYVAGTMTVTTPDDWTDEAFSLAAHISFVVTGTSD
ncbi:hypothetical protein [Agromyces sp. PvR057]|uniref:hypothetical protein n=1 Tax=Agromyces sp. PvR057 TaxID=3156403 RepID=UPI00339354FF